MTISMLTTLLLADAVGKRDKKEKKAVPGIPHPHRGHRAAGALRVKPVKVKPVSFKTKL